MSNCGRLMTTVNQVQISITHNSLLLETSSNSAIISQLSIIITVLRLPASHRPDHYGHLHALDRHDPVNGGS